MHITLRLICESLSRIAVKLSFLWCFKHCVYAAVSFAAIVRSWYLRNLMQNFTSVILYLNIICNAQWLFGANFDILDCSADFTRHQKRFKQENTFKQTCVDFLPRKYDAISQLRHSYAKGPFCVARLKCQITASFNTDWLDRLQLIAKQDS